MKQKRSAKIAQNSPTLRNIKPLLGQGHKTYSLGIFAFPDPNTAPVRRGAIVVALRSIDEKADCFRPGWYNC
jgi:hypothetical protein